MLYILFDQKACIHMFFEFMYMLNHICYLTIYMYTPTLYRLMFLLNRYKRATELIIAILMPLPTPFSAPAHIAGAGCFVEAYFI